jgi:uncharacterized protein (DUF58 family)
MRAAASSRLAAHLGLAGVGLLAALLLRRPEPAILAAPFLLGAVVGLALASRPQLEVSARLESERAVEGEHIEVTVEVTADRRLAWLGAELVLPRGLFAETTRDAGPLPAGAARHLSRRVRCDRWGGYRLGGVRVFARDPLGYFRFETALAGTAPLKVYPRPEAVRRLLQPAETQIHSGNEVSRVKGEGIEFAAIRAFVPGDRVRRINWRVSARRGEIHVNEMHPERNADVVIFLDTFSELTAAGVSTLDLCVRGAAALVEGYLDRRDRVGLIAFGGTLRWLRPQMGERQLYRVVDALLDTEVVLSYAWKGIEVIPPRTLPPQSLVVAFSPLTDERSVTALLDLCARGHDLAVVEVSPLRFLEPGRSEVDRLAHRIWEMERAALRARYVARGVPVAVWHPGSSLQAALEEVSGFRRYARHARV